MNDQADPEFLALSQRTRDRIDRVFDRAVRKSERAEGGRKRRKLNPEVTAKSSIQASAAVEDAGGFLPDDDEGGFIPDDGAGGGFMDEDGDGDGGFIPDDDVERGFMPGEDEGGFIANDPGPETSQPSQSGTPARDSTAKIALSRIPALLASLNLPADEDVLGVFRASATGWADDDTADATRRRRLGGGGEEGEGGDAKLGVERKDFRAVCAALMGGDEPDEGTDGAEGEGEGGDVDKDGADEGAGLGPGRRRQRPATRRTPSPSPSDSEDDDEDGDGFEPSDNSSLSSLSSDSEYGASKRQTRRKDANATPSKGSGATSRAAAGSGKSKGKGKARATGTDTDASAPATRRRKNKKDALIAEDGPIKLNSRQKEMVKILWEMLKPPQRDEGGNGKGFRRGKGASNQNVLGRDEVKAWVRQLGEMWTEDEVSVC